MSRTDKDRPWWVRVNDELEIRYAHHRHHSSKYSWEEDFKECTINFPATARHVKDYATCWYNLGYNFSHSYTLSEKYAHGSKKPSEDRHLYIHSPLRRHRRDILGKIKNEYNTFYDIEDYDFPEINVDFEWYD